MEALAFVFVLAGVVLVLGMVALKVLLLLVLLPFKLLGGLFKMVFGLLGVLFGFLFSGAAVVGVLLALVFGLVLLPLLPSLLLGALVWMAARAGRPRTITRVA